MTPEEFTAAYDAATTNEEKYNVLIEGLGAYSRDVGLAAAAFMDAVEAKNWREATVIGDDMSMSLRAMNTVFSLLAFAEANFNNEEE